MVEMWIAGVSLGLFAAACAFLATGATLLGKGSPKEAGFVQIFVGFFQTIAIFITVSEGIPYAPQMLFMFAIVWFSFGFANITGRGLEPLMWGTCPVGGLFYTLDFFYELSVCAYTFAGLALAWAILFWLFVPPIFGKAGAKAVGWYISILGIVADFIPAWLLIMGIPLP